MGRSAGRRRRRHATRAARTAAAVVARPHRANPRLDGIIFYEVLAKSALNKVPGAAAVPFEWTINPYRGCSHACTYCFARRTHSYLELDTGAGFDSQIVVKIDVVDRLRRELARPSWQRDPVALGTNTDLYQRAEGRYRLMPGIARALAGSGTPFSILTKGTTLRRDLPLLADLATSAPIGVGVSLAQDRGRRGRRGDGLRPAPAIRGAGVVLEIPDSTSS